MRLKTSMYKENLGKIFTEINPTNGQRHDKEGYPWAFRADINRKVEGQNKILYAIGDSWLHGNLFHRVIINSYPEYFFINKSVGGISNGIIIDLLRQDLQVLNLLNVEVVFLVCLSEVGRSSQELYLENPKNYKSTHEYFGAILKKQVTMIENIIGDHSNFITTAFISNNFNDNPSIVDFCSGTGLKKPENVFTVYGNGIFEFIKERPIFQFDLASDLDKALRLRDFLGSHQDIDDTLHPDSYEPYDKFIKHFFSNLTK